MSGREPDLERARRLVGDPLDPGKTYRERWRRVFYAKEPSAPPDWGRCESRTTPEGVRVDEYFDREGRLLSTISRRPS